MPMPPILRRSERDCHSTLPGDIVLRLVEAVPIELVDVVAAFRAHAEATKAILESGAEIACKLRPRTVGVQLMHADCAGAAEQIGNERSRACRDRAAQHEPGAVRALVELAAPAQRRGPDTVLPPVSPGAPPDS